MPSVAERNGTLVAERVPLLRARRRFRIREQTLMGYLFLAPAAIILLTLVGYPSITAIWYSFHHRVVGFPQAPFVGLRNYIELLRTPRVVMGIGRAFSYSFITWLFKLPIGMLTALLLNEAFRGRGLVRGIVLLPWALPISAVILTWRWMYDPLFGVFNHILKEMGLITESIHFLGRGLAFPSLCLTNIWRGFPFYSVMLLAGLQAIPSDLYEAAMVDGASRWQRFIHITIPGLRPVIYIVSLLSFIWTANDFASVWILTAGGPAGATETFPIVTYQLAFANMQLGKAAALPVLLTPIFLGCIVLLIKVMAGREVEGW